MNSGLSLPTVAVCVSCFSSDEKRERAASTIPFIRCRFLFWFALALRAFTVSFFNSPFSAKNRIKRLCPSPFECNHINSTARNTYLEPKNDFLLYSKNHDRHAVNHISAVYSNPSCEHVPDIESLARILYPLCMDHIF